LGAEVDDAVKDVGVGGCADIAEQYGIAMRQVDATSSKGAKVHWIVGLLKEMRAYKLCDVVRDSLGNPASQGVGAEVEAVAQGLDCEPPWRRVGSRK
jgi:hypothetical protein